MAKTERDMLQLGGDARHREPVAFIRHEDGSLHVWIDGGESGDTEAGFYSIEAERTFSPEEVAKLIVWLTADSWVVSQFEI